MSGTFRAIQINKIDDKQTAALVELSDADLMDGDVTVDISHSTLNYKDGLALTAKAPIIRKFPLTSRYRLCRYGFGVRQSRLQAW